MLDDFRREKLMGLFAAGAELEPAERAAFVERSCEGDEELRAELDNLLSVSNERLTGFLVEPAFRLSDGLAHADASRPTLQIPGYTDLEVIGGGGMGTVYRAREESPVQRMVAIKAIRPGMDSRQVLARFDAERQALARVAHPYIAAVYDAGTDALGRPYLAMEYVDGVPITDYCRDHDLDLAPLLRLFVKVCDAVDHAHRRGVLHRDLKPGNVLVVHADAEPMPKVIDFGIAKALEGSLGDESVHTMQGTLLGTPEYMSPEQVVGDGRLVDTRSDVYALGAILYELLTGERPFDSLRLRAAGLTRMAEIIRNELPVRPSARQRQGATSRGPRRAAATWAGRLHSDLDWVVMMALEKDPERRYGTPRELAADLRRFLAHEPIAAGPPSGIYRLRRFGRRYRLQLTAGALVVIALAGGLVSTSWFLIEAKRNEAEARANATEAEGNRIAATAALVAAEDPNLALLLAVEASRLTDDFAVNETILGVLPQQNLVARFLHSDHGTSVAMFLADDRLLSCGFDPVFWSTDVDSGKTRGFVGHSDRVFGVAPSPSQMLVASASADTTARIWDLATGDCRAVLAHPGAVTQIAWSPDGTAVWTRCEDGVVRAFAATDGTQLRAFGTGLMQFAFSDDGQRIATVDSTTELAVWSAEGTLQQTIPAEPWYDAGNPLVPVESCVVRFVGDGALLARTVQRRDLPVHTVLYADGRRIGEPVQGDPLCTLGERLLLANTGGGLALSIASGEVVERYAIPGLNTLLAVAADGRHAVGFDVRRDLCLVDLPGRRITRRLAGETEKNARNRCIAFHRDGARFVVTGRELSMWRFEAEYEPFDLPLTAGDKVVGLAAAGEASALVRHGGGDRRWSLWSLDRRQQRGELPIEGVDELLLVSDGTRLCGLSEQPTVAGQVAQAVVSTFDLDGRRLSAVTLPFSGSVRALRPEGDLYAFVEASGDRRRAHVFDVQTGTPRFDVAYEASWIAWGSGPEGRYLATLFGGGTRTDVFDLATAARLASVRGPTGVGHFGAAIDERRGRLLVVLGDLRARSYALDGTGSGPTGEYARLVRSNNYPCGFLPDGSLAWVSCSNEVHLFEATTCAPFAALRLGADVAFVAARADSSELWTVTQDGRCQRWPLDTGAVAQRLALGALTKRQRDLYRIGTPAERLAAEELRLAAHPTPRNLALLGEAALERGALDEAIDTYRRCCESGPLAPVDRRRYLRLLELLGRRLALPGRSQGARAADEAVAAAAVREALRCGATREDLALLPGLDALVAEWDARVPSPR